MTPTGVEARICALIAERQQSGLQTYGTTVANNPLPLRDWLAHQRDELLDGAIYAQRAIDEIDATEASNGAQSIRVMGSTCEIRADLWRHVGPLPEFGYGRTLEEAQQDYFRRNK